MDRFTFEKLRITKMERAFEFLMAVAWWAVVFTFFMDAMK
jgi:hypothetical protein